MGFISFVKNLFKKKKPVFKARIGEGLENIPASNKDILELGLGPLRPELVDKALIADVKIKTPVSTPGIKIKLPFIQKEIVRPETEIDEMFKGLIEWPEKSTKSIFYAFTQPNVVPERDEKKITIPTYQEDLKNLIDGGMSPLVALSLTGFSAMLDVSVGALWLNNAAKRVAINLFPRVGEVELARTAMGLPNKWTQTDRQFAYKKASHILHPDKPGGSAELFKQLNNSNQILMKAKTPTLAEKGLYTGARRLTSSPLSYDPNVSPFIKVEALLPEIAGTKPAQPFIGHKPLKSLGLSLEEKNLIQLNQTTSLIEEAKKFKSADEFVKAQPKLLHGSNIEIKQVNPDFFGKGEGWNYFGEGTYLTTDTKNAKYYADLMMKERGGKAVLNEMMLDKSTKLFDATKNYKPNELKILLGKDFGKIPINNYIREPFGEISGLEFYQDYLQTFPEILKRNGFDGVKLDSIGGAISKTKGAKDYLIWNTNKIKTKSQLTDIWNKANAGIKPPSAQKLLGQKPSEFVSKREMTLLKDKIRTISRSIKEGISISKSEMKTVQEEVISMVNTSELEAADKSKFILALKNIQTEEQFIKASPEIVRRITNLERAAERRIIKSQLRKELSNTKVKTKNGKPVGKYTPEIQGILNTIRDALKLTQDAAGERIAANINKYSIDIPYEVVLENKILSAFGKDSTVEELQEALDLVTKIKDTGKLTNELNKFNRSEEIDRERNFVIDRVTGGKGIKEGKITFGLKENRLKHTFKSLGKQWMLDWEGQLEALDFNMGAGDSKLASTFGTLEQDNSYRVSEVDFTKDFEIALTSSYNIKKSGIHKKMLDLGDDVKLGTFKNADGVTGEMIMTRDEMIKRWMELQDETLYDSFIEGNRYTEEIVSAIDKAMTIEDKSFANSQIELYRKQYTKVNPIYRDIYGIDLPFNESYSPIRRSGFKEDELSHMGEFLIESGDRIAVSSKSFISRVKTELPIEIQGGIQTLSRHIKETNYFVSYAKQMRRLQSIFNNATVREAIKQEFGSPMNRAIANTLNDITTSGNKNARTIRALDYFRKNFTIGALAIKPVIGIKQLVSTVAYLEKLGPIEFTVGILDFWRHPIKNTKILNNESELIGTRGIQGNIERDIKAAQGADVLKAFNKKQNFMNIAMMNVRIGDKGAIIAGSWALRRARLKQGLPIKDIVKEYENFSASTQQSADLSRLSEIQRGGSFEKLFTMFKSSPRQYLQKEINVIKSLFQKGGFRPSNLKKVARVLAIYHIMIPVLFQYVANLGGWKEEDKKEYLRAGILGSLNGLFIAGDIIDGVLRQAMKLNVWDNELFLVQIGDIINKGIRKLDFEDITSEDMIDALGEWSDAGNFFAIPVKQTKTFVGGIVDILHKDIKKGIGGLLGWSSYITDDLESLDKPSTPGDFSNIKDVKRDFSNIKEGKRDFSNIKEGTKDFSNIK